MSGVRSAVVAGSVFVLSVGACSFAWDAYAPIRADTTATSSAGGASSSGGASAQGGGGSGGAPTGSGGANTMGGGGAAIDPIEVCVSACLALVKCEIGGMGGGMGIGGAGALQMLCDAECSAIVDQCGNDGIAALADCASMVDDTCANIAEIQLCIEAIACLNI